MPVVPPTLSPFLTVDQAPGAVSTGCRGGRRPLLWPVCRRGGGTHQPAFRCPPGRVSEREGGVVEGGREQGLLARPLQAQGTIEGLAWVVGRGRRRVLKCISLSPKK